MLREIPGTSKIHRNPEPHLPPYSVWQGRQGNAVKHLSACFRTVPRNPFSPVVREIVQLLSRIMAGV